METQRHHSDEEVHFSTVVRDIAQDLSKLVRQEIALGKAEMRDEVEKVQNAFHLMTGYYGAVILATGLAVLAGVKGMEAIGFSAWLAYTFFALLFIGVAVSCRKLAKRWMQGVRPVPTETIENVQENVKWLRKQM